MVLLQPASQFCGGTDFYFLEIIGLDHLGDRKMTFNNMLQLYDGQDFLPQNFMLWTEFLACAKLLAKHESLIFR
jgi:hypothetical protein